METPDRPEAERIRVGWVFWFQWVLASTLGLAVGWAVDVTVFLAVDAPLPVALAVGGAPAGALLGATVGSMQWLVLRRKVPWAGRWVLVSAVGGAAALAVGGLVSLALIQVLNILMIGPVYFAFAVGITVFGAVAGIMQWLILRRHVSRAGWWMLASPVAGLVGQGLGRAAAVSVGLVLLDFGLDDYAVVMLGAVVEAATVGAVVGAITGGTLVWLLRRPVRALSLIGAALAMLGIGLAVIVLGGRNRLPHAVSPSWSPDGTRLAFISESNIYVMNADGSDLARIVEDASFDCAPPRPPAWSPDGRQIAYSYKIGRGKSEGIAVVNSDGSAREDLTYADDAQPVWSPDGQQLAYHSFHDDHPDIFVINVDGSGRRRLTTNPAYDGSPAWSPNGRQIAFERQVFGSDSGGKDGVHIMNADGSDLRWLAEGFSPVWSPDGQRIAFTSSSKIHLIKVDGRGLMRLVGSPHDDRDPNWSPDGKKIAFASGWGLQTEVYVMNADGSGVRRLTHNESIDWMPTWSPDGSQIAFVSDRDGADHIYLMDADGSNVVQLTD